MNDSIFHKEEAINPELYQRMSGLIMQERELPPRIRGQLRSSKITLGPKEKGATTSQQGFFFWPDRWRVDVIEGDLASLYLREVTIGTQKIYPRYYNSEPGGYGMISRKRAAEIEALMHKHHVEGCPVSAAMEYSLEEYLLHSAMRISWTFENKSEAPVSFLLIIEGQELDD